MRAGCRPRDEDELVRGRARRPSGEHEQVQREDPDRPDHHQTTNDARVTGSAVDLSGVAVGTRGAYAQGTFASMGCSMAASFPQLRQSQCHRTWRTYFAGR